jgi:Protein of unknown function (DUF3467)
MNMATATEKKTLNEVPRAAATPLKWDTNNLQSSYANFCNANSTREEVVLNFGVNKSWERGPKQELEIELNHRIVLSPFAAKRLTQLMQNLMKEYEARYGALPDQGA